MKHLFTNDYSELVDEEILKAIIQYASEQNVAYGLDYHSKRAEQLIKDVFHAENAEVHFLAGGTQTNMVLISKCLKSYEGVISADSGHINVHETASIEATGHKIYTVKATNGKIYPKDIEHALRINRDEHMVKLKMVYISNSTEIGTIYSLKELKDLHDVCKKHDLYLFLDGARLGSALTSDTNDVQPKDIVEICDAFYIGGTKNGLMLGEALVINNKELAKDFRYHIKNKGAMLAKGYLIGIQFERAFTDNHYFNLARKTNEVASILNNYFKTHNYELLDSPTNQIFVKMDRAKALKIIDDWGCELWEDLDNQLIIRFVVSFKTTKDDVYELIQYLDNLK